MEGDALPPPGAPPEKNTPLPAGPDPAPPDPEPLCQFVEPAPSPVRKPGVPDPDAALGSRRGDRLTARGVFAVPGAIGGAAGAGFGVEAIHGWALG